MVSKGMFDISKNDARLLCDIAATPDDWDKELERRKEEEAKIEEEEKKARRDFMKTQLSIARAINALKIKNRNSSSSDRTLS
jgi:F0F1-type ATP synthase epsilon subunit